MLWGDAGVSRDASVAGRDAKFCVSTTDGVMVEADFSHVLELYSLNIIFFGDCIP